MDDKIFDKIHEVDLKERMETFYIDYAMSVIASRALPDVRDGLKPVQRRILYAIMVLTSRIVNVRVLSVMQWVNIIRMVIHPSTVHWSIWLRTGQQDIRW